MIKLPFVDKVEFKNEFTLRQILDAYFNLKSHKFDKWYELFSSCKVKENGKDITITMVFDHGS